MTSIEQTGRSIEEATQLALEQLGVTEDEVDVEIIEEGSKGFLGLGQSPARVRVSLRDGREAKKSRIAETEAPAVEPEQIEEPEVEAAPAVETAQEIAPVMAESPSVAEPTEQPIEQVAEAAREILQHILEGIGDKAKVVVKSASDRQILLDMVGGETAVLVGKHGQMINALQYLLGIILNKRTHGQIRIVLDAEGYRARREDMLRNQALSLASKVKETGQEAVLEPLHAHERRVVHMALADDPNVETYSEGNEPERYVVISPKK